MLGFRYIKGFRLAVEYTLRLLLRSPECLIRYPRRQTTAAAASSPSCNQSTIQKHNGAPSDPGVLQQKVAALSVFRVSLAVCAPCPLACRCPLSVLVRACCPSLVLLSCMLHLYPCLPLLSYSAHHDGVYLPLCSRPWRGRTRVSSQLQQGLSGVAAVSYESSVSCRL